LRFNGPERNKTGLLISRTSKGSVPFFFINYALRRGSQKMGKHSCK
jgi:hypothetical protein